MVTIGGRRNRWRDEFADTHPPFGPEFPLDPYLSTEWRDVRNRARSAFRGRCYIDREDAEGPGGRLETAHIDYPDTGPGTERINAQDLTQSDVVLLCHWHHRELDRRTHGAAFANTELLRRTVIGLIEQWRRVVEGDDE